MTGHLLDRRTAVAFEHDNNFQPIVRLLSSPQIGCEEPRKLPRGRNCVGPRKSRLIVRGSSLRGCLLC